MTAQPNNSVPDWVQPDDRQSYLDLTALLKLLSPEWGIMHHKGNLNRVSVVIRNTKHALPGMNCFDLLMRLNRELMQRVIEIEGTEAE